MIRQKLIDYCGTHPVGVFLLRLFATLLSTIALIAAIVAVVQERPVTTYVDSEEASFGSYWRIPVRGSKQASNVETNEVKILLAALWNLSQLICLCVRGRQYPKSSWLAVIELCIFTLLIVATAAFLGENRPHDEKQPFGFSAVEGWLGMFARYIFFSHE
jgi:ABC-type transport system involved in cytochrome c biogenesis permease subunit